MVFQSTFVIIGEDWKPGLQRFWLTCKPGMHRFIEHEWILSAINIVQHHFFLVKGLQYEVPKCKIFQDWSVSEV